MRPGLVAVGVAFALLGAAVLVSVIDPIDNPTVTRSSAVSAADLNPGTNQSFVVNATSANPASVTIGWNSSNAVAVSWYAAVPCPIPPHTCVAGPALVTWGPPQVTGTWSFHGSSGGAYVLYVQASPANHAATSFRGTFTEHYRPSGFSLPLVPFLLTLAAASVLIGIGAVMLYLGLFLPPGTYAPSDDPVDPEESVDATAGSRIGPRGS